MGNYKHNHMSDNFPDFNVLDVFFFLLLNPLHVYIACIGARLGIWNWTIFSQVMVQFTMILLVFPAKDFQHLHQLGQVRNHGCWCGSCCHWFGVFAGHGLGATVRHGPCDEMMREKYCTQDIQEVFRHLTNHVICASTIWITWVLMEKI